MSFETYDDLQAEVQSFLWDRDDVATRIPSFIRLAETEAKRLLRTREVNGRRDFIVTGDLAGIPCGAGTIKAIRLGTTEGGSRDLDYLSPEQFSTMTPERSSDPRFYTVQNDQIWLYPAPVGTISGHIVFNEPFEPLSNVCRSNWLLKRHPDIYLCGALKWGKAWLIDGDWDWATPFYDAIEAANRDDPRVQGNTKLRADEASMVAGRGGFDMITGGIR